MPYYVHEKDSEPTTGLEYADRADAYLHKSTAGSDHVVTFILTDAERDGWQMREQNRFDNGTYRPVPWMVWAPTKFHYAHLSVKYPGQIAYTPTDEHGYQDRQVPIKPGKYLTEFLSDYYTSEDIAYWVDQVKVLSGVTPFSLTRDPDEIVSIYTNNPESLRSCMSRGHSCYLCSPLHPAVAYGHSPDLAVAYLGTVDNPTARCVVWPERKIRTKVYGAVLRASLETAEYAVGSFEGARILAIEDPNSSGAYVMPYIDGAESAGVDPEDKNYLRLYEDPEAGSFPTHITRDYLGNTLPTGLTIEADDDDDHGECNNCGGRCTDGDDYCDSCEAERYTCDDCGDHIWDSVHTVNDSEILCDDCYTRRVESCSDEHCSRTWIETELDPADQLESGSDLREYCPRCRELYSTCESCDSLYDTRDEDCSSDYCSECKPSDDDDDDDDDDHSDESDDSDDSAERADETDDTADTRTPDYANEIRIPLENGTVVYEPILYCIGAICVHRRINAHTLRPYVVAHVLTGRICMSVDTLDEALCRAYAFASPGVDWNFTDHLDVPPATREHAISVLNGSFTSNGIVRDIPADIHRSVPQEATL